MPWFSIMIILKTRWLVGGVWLVCVRLFSDAAYALHLVPVTDD